jgi:hypothetical protein
MKTENSIPITALQHFYRKVRAVSTAFSNIPLQEAKRRASNPNSETTQLRIGPVREVLNDPDYSRLKSKFPNSLSSFRRFTISASTHPPPSGAKLSQLDPTRLKSKSPPPVTIAQGRNRGNNAIL